MKTNYAEVKPAKFGETLTYKDEGNPEQASEGVRGCVETVRRVCKKCGNELKGRKRSFSTPC